MADARYIIDLILNARDNTTLAFARATANMRAFDALQKDVERQNRATADSFERVTNSIDRNTQRLDRARERYERLSNAAVRAEVELQRAAQANARTQADANSTAAEREAALRRLEAATRSYKRSLQEAEREENRFSESGARGRARRIADQSEQIANFRELQRQAQAVAREEERISRERQQRQQRELDAPRRYLEMLRQIQRIERERARSAEIGDTVTTARLDFDDREARRKAAALADELKILFRRAEVNVNLDDAEARKHAAELLAMKAVLGRDIELNVDLDIAAASAKLAFFEEEVRRANRPNAFGLLTGSIRETADAFTSASQKIATFDNFLRGLAAVSVFAFFNQLILLAGAAASNLLSLASSASLAGAALGGGLAAGLAQALPMLGIFAAALIRFKAVMDAVRQANLLQQQESYRAPERNRRIADSVDQVRAAEDRLADAHRRVRDAQEQLTQARETARRKLEDLILTERGARLSVDESQAAIRNATSVSDLDRAFLNRDEARLNLRRTSSELAMRLSVGIEGAPEVRAAQDQVTAARRAVDDARRSVEKAARSADIAGDNITAAAGKLNFLLDQLSPAERRLYVALKRFQDEFRESSQIVVEPLIDATVRGLGRLTSIMRDPAVLGSMTDLAERMVAAGNRVFDAATSDRSIRQYLRITEQAKENLEPSADILINIGQGFLDIAEAAGPALHEMILLFRDITRAAGEFIAETARSGQLTDFFLEGVRHLKAWGDLLWQIVRLFAAITGVGGGADAGYRLITRLADAIGGFADKVFDADSKQSRFFRNFFVVGQRMLFALTPVLEALALQFAALFDEEGVRSVQSFAFFLSDILIPAVGQFAATIGSATTFIGELFRQFPILRDAMVGLIATMLTLSVGGKLAVVFTPVIAPLRFIVRLLGERESILARILAMLGRLPVVGAGLAGIATTFGLSGGRGSAAAAAGVATVAGGISRSTLTSTASRVILPAGVDIAGEAARRGSRLGSIFGSTFSTAARGLLRKAGWVGVGLAAVDGLMSAFRYRSIEAGIQDFANSMSFGLIDSFKEKTEKSMDRALDELNDRIERRSRNTRVPGFDAFRLGRERGPVAPAGGRPVPGTFGTRERDTPLQNWIDELKKVDPVLGALFERIFGRYQRTIDRFSRSMREGLSDLITGRISTRRISDLDRIIADVGTALDSLPRTRKFDYLRERLDEIRDAAIRARRTLRTELDADNLNLNFGLLLQRRDIDVARAITGYIRHLRRLPPEARRQAAESMLDLTRGLEARRAIPEGTARRFSRRIGDAMTTWTTRSTRRGVRAMRDLATIMSGISNIVAVSMRDMVSGVNSVLSAFGIGNIRMPREISRRDLTTGARIVTGVAGFLSDAVLATGGFVGNQGERGKDTVHAVLGRGEAVLNWAHQKLVEPALRAYYGIGLGDMFNRTSALHAGMGRVGGYAGGGYTGPAGSGEGFTPIANFAKQKFNLTMTAGRTDHSYLTSSGNVSDHSKGLAGDFSNGFAPTPQMDGFNAFWKQRLPQTVKQLIWRGMDQFSGVPISDHFNHVHLAVQPAFAFNAALMARILSRASRGLSIMRLMSLANVDSAEGAEVDHVHRVILRGRGKLRDLAQKMLDKIVRGANRYIDSKANTDLGNIKSGPNDIDLLPKGQGISVGASEFGGPGDPGTGTTGYRGDNLAVHPDSYAELSNPGSLDFSALGGLPYMTKLRITGPRGSAIAYKRDVGAGGGPVGSLPRAIDLWYALANAIGVSGLAPVKIQRLAQGGLAGIQQFAAGGRVRGPDGAPVQIIAHAGEWVLNRVQQSRLARMVGLGLEDIKGYLGFPGESSTKRHFDSGGVVSSTYPGPRFNIAPITFDDINREIEIVFRAIRSIGRGRKGNAESFGKQVDRFNDNLRYLIGENGYLFTLGNAIDEVTNRLSLTLNLAQAGLRRVGLRLARRRPIADDAQIAQSMINQLRTIEQDLIRARQQIIRALRANRRRLNDYLRVSQRENRDELDDLIRDRRDLRRQRELRRLLAGRRPEDRLTQRQLDRYIRLRRADDDLVRLLDENSQRRIDNINARREQFVARFQANTARQLRGVQRRTAGTDAEIERLQIQGGTEGDLGPLLRIRQERLINERRIIAARLLRARAAARRNPAMQAVVQDLEEQLSGLNTDIIQATRDIAENSINALFSYFEDRNASVNVKTQIAQILGQSGAITNLTRQSLDLANEEINALNGALANTTDPDLRKRITDRLAELSVTVTDLTAQLLQAAIDEVDRQAAATERTLGLRERLSNLRERGGDVLGAITQRQQISSDRVASLQDQRQRYAVLLMQAMLQGNEGAVRDLTDRIADLDVTIQEEIAANRDLTYAYRQAAVDIITGQSTRSTGLIGAARGILQNLSEILGQPITAYLLRLAADTAAILREEAARIINTVNESLLRGEFTGDAASVIMQLLSAFAAGPEQFARVLATLAPVIASLEATMSDAEREAFQRLIQAMLDNTTATVDNTRETRDLTDSMVNPQSWASSAWQWYREAIFNGMGGVLPQYNMPGLNTTSSPAIVNPNSIAPTFVSNLPNFNRAGRIGVREGDLNITVNSGEGPPDVQYLANRIAFAKKNWT